MKNFKRKLAILICFLIIVIQQIFIGYLMLDEGEKREGWFIPKVEGQPKPCISEYSIFYKGAMFKKKYWTARNNAGKEALHIEPPFEAWEINNKDRRN